ncbi:asparagine synthase-related protein [Streptomyces sp. 4F14]|uniref:asparagine synthetase B family protein n=1 Tax=Streptomyces sp. 4F14 TaxID=3394380 RepID=UPI003A8499C4
MLETHLPLTNVCWNPAQGAHSTAVTPDTANSLLGRFCDVRHDGERVIALRDPLGLNKLYAAFRPDTGVIVANYLIDLIRSGAAFTGIYAIPPGSIVTLAPRERTGTVHRYAELPTRAGSGRAAGELAAETASLLDQGMRHLAAARPRLPVAVCLSGGADSSVIASYTRQYFPHATAYTYSPDGQPLSEDATAAQAVADHLGLPFRLVRADRQDLLDAIPAALVHGQDWRDFNVHAALVNEILAAAIANDHPAGALVLTGDLMNEFLADYTPVTHRGTDHYRLPRLPPDRLRVHLTRGLQTGDREVGVFTAHGLTVVQPYSWAASQLLALPHPVSKPRLMTALARGTLPEHILQRPKLRAQIGDRNTDTGVLPQLLDAGIDQQHLEDSFRRALLIRSPQELHSIVRGGVHQPVPTPLIPAEGHHAPLTS